VTQNSYFNTTLEPVQLCIEYERKAQEQEALVLACFYQLTTASPFQVYKKLLLLGKIKENTPLTSIRRAITNLTKRGILKKTRYKVSGAWGRQEGLWELVNQET
jgi:predicted transcriptional regulator